MLRAFELLREPVPAAKKAALAARWAELPAELQVGWQVVGRHFTHCGYTLGASYCSFGCTHCYLPRNANQVPLPSFEEMKAQIDANFAAIGHAGNLQITGGDVLDAYVRADRVDELVAVIRYATSRGVVPMVMTHGQRLLDHPLLLERLVREAGLRKVAIHIDLTQAGRPGFPLKHLQGEADLHPLRQDFVELIEEVRQKTGVSFFAAHTMTITERNLGDVGKVVRWLIADRRRLDAFRMLSLQPEAEVGRTLASTLPRIKPEQCWHRLEEALGLELGTDNLWFGHPKCSHMVSLLVLYPEQRLINLMPSDDASREYWGRLIEVMGGVGARGYDHFDANLRRLGQIARRPSILWRTAAYARRRLREERISLFELGRRLAGRNFGILNVVQHNFMSAEEVQSHSPEVEARLAACSFRGAVQREGAWQMVPMCAMNGEDREALYRARIEAARGEASTPARQAAGG